MTTTFGITQALASHGTTATIYGTYTYTGAFPLTLDVSYDGGNTFPDTVPVTAASGTFSLAGTTIL